MAPRTITSTQAAEVLGVANGDVARYTLARWGVKPVARQIGRGGENLYLLTEVRRALAARPGRGARTDLRKKGT